MGILSIMVVNNHGQPRLLKFYKEVPHAQREGVVREAFQLVSKRPDAVCNFLEGTEVSTHRATLKVACHCTKDDGTDPYRSTAAQRSAKQLFSFIYPFLTTHIRHDSIFLLLLLFFSV